MTKARNIAELANDISVDNNRDVTLSNLRSDQPMMFRNRIINGDMRIDQRNGGASVSNANSYTLDRWYFMRGALSSSPVFNVQQSSTAPSGFKNSLSVTVGTAGAPGTSNYSSLYSRVEGFNVADLGWGTVSAQSTTLSFWVYSSVTGTFGVAFQNNALDRSYIASYTINSANTWEYKTVTIAGDTTGTWLSTSEIGIGLYWDIGVGITQSTTAGSWQAGNFLGLTGGTKVSNTNGATWYITGVQLEKGTVATPFEHRPYGTELALCQRYYYKATVQSTWGNSDSYAMAFFYHPVEMRSSPTRTQISNSTGTLLGGTLNSLMASQQISSIGGENASTVVQSFSAEL